MSFRTRFCESWLFRRRREKSKKAEDIYSWCCFCVAPLETLHMSCHSRAPVRFVPQISDSSRKSLPWLWLVFFILTSAIRHLHLTRYAWFVFCPFFFLLVPPFFAPSCLVPPAECHEGQQRRRDWLWRRASDGRGENAPSFAVLCCAVRRLCPAVPATTRPRHVPFCSAGVQETEFDVEQS